MKTLRTEQIWLRPDKNISKLCHLSKNLFNQANYIIKNSEKSKWIRYGELDKIFNGKGTEPSENYKQLPSSVAQNILIGLDKFERILSVSVPKKCTIFFLSASIRSFSTVIYKIQ